jgi:large subunit ribosomal protein L1
MAQTKKELLAEAEKLGITIDSKAKIANIKKAIQTHAQTVTEVVPAEPAVEEVSEAKDNKPIAKAGKRSAKALEEAAEKQAKAERKVSGETEKPKAPVKPSRSRLERRGKLFRKSAEQIEKGKFYTLEQAVELAKKTSHVKFDATVELHVNLGVDPKLADQNVRDNLVLPAGTGKTVRVAIADDALLAKLDKSEIDFDVLVSTPEFMPKLGRYARVLGPRGLMPNPKSGTVTADTAKAVKEAQGGRVEYRVDAAGIVHLGVGKVSFTPTQLLQNVQAVMTSLKANKPASLKGNYITSIYLTTSMGPSIAVDPTKV